MRLSYNARLLVVRKFTQSLINKIFVDFSLGIKKIFVSYPKDELSRNLRNVVPVGTYQEPCARTCT
jgi:hypothetical protein